MNYNLITYGLYLPIILFITIRVGWLFYKNGEVFLLTIFDQHPIAYVTNKVLLVGYYLVNIGGSVVAISFWGEVESLLEVWNSLSTTLGLLLLLLALMHYNNIFLLKIIALKKLIHH